MKTIKAISIGREVKRLLSSEKSARVIGSTSKGIFAITAEKEVIFISYESCRSPLTLNLGKLDNDLRQVEIGEEVELFSDGLRFSGGRIEVNCADLSPWTGCGQCDTASKREAMATRICWLAEKIVAEKPDIGFSPLVSKLILKKKQAMSAGENATVERHIENILRRGERGNLIFVLKEMEGILGFGRGLTPSGDDFALGFLMAVNRWGNALGYDVDQVVSFNHDLSQMAEQKTTSLSTALIRLAADGEGDERQLNVLDGILSGNPALEVCLTFILEMGNSSGIDSFLGMAAGVL